MTLAPPPEQQFLNPQTVQGGVDLRYAARRAWRLIWYGKPILAAFFLVVMVPTLLYLQQTTRRYSSDAKILIEAPDTGDILMDRGISSQARWLPSDTLMQTEADLIDSVLLAGRVVDKLHLADDPEFNPELATPKPLASFLRLINPIRWIYAAGESRANPVTGLSPEAQAAIKRAAIVNMLRDAINVKAERRSLILSVQATSVDREKAALIANTMAELYVVDRLEASFEEARRVSEWLGERLEVLRKEAQAAESAVEQYRAQHDLKRSNQGVNTGDQQTTELTSKLAVARADLAQRRAKLEQMRTILRAGGNVDSASDVMQSPLIQHLRQLEGAKSQELSEASKIYLERHPRVVGLKADLEDLHRQIAAQVEKVVAAVANDVDVAAAGVQTLERQIDGLRQRANVQGDAMVHLRELERQADAANRLYEAFLTRFKREAERGQMQRANARIVSPADIPMSATWPRTNLIVTVALLIAVLGGVGLVFLIDVLDDTLRSVDDLDDISGLPTLALIPMQTANAENPTVDLIKRPRSPLADAVRTLRSALELGDKTETGRVVMVTSSVPKEGKTFVSLCLTVMFAKFEDRVLLIDGDVHRPTQHKLLGLSADRGLAQVLLGEAKFEDVVVRDIAGKFDFLPAGRYPNQTELLQSDEIRALMSDLTKRYSRIILDSPPVLAVADARVLARMADRVIYLVRWDSTTRDAVRNGLKALRAAGISVYGMALSQVNQRKHARYGYGDYGHYYGRYHDYYGG